MKRITDIHQLNSGDKIWRITDNCNLEIIEFLCIHPHNEEYSLFIDENKDGMPKFYNSILQDPEYYLYEDKSTKDIIKEKIRILELRLKHMKQNENMYRMLFLLSNENTEID